MTTDKTGIQHLADILYKKGLRTAILSPGSRNAPLVLAFNRHPGIECLSIIDERCAAFFALGMAQQSRKPVAIVATSGTAALNYAPAIAEAYYQEIPMIVLTADRPIEFIDQAEGQSIRQKGIYANYIKASFELPQEIYSNDDQWYNDRIVSQAFNEATIGRMGPVHINVPFREPLYQLAQPSSSITKIITRVETRTSLPGTVLKNLTEIWHLFPRKMILTGMLHPDMELNHVLENISEKSDLVVLTETASNLSSDCFFPSIDRVISSLSPTESSNFAPDLLITFGNQVISKMIKAFLRKNPPKAHWHIEASGYAPDTYQSLNKIIPVRPVDFINAILPITKGNAGDYQQLWKQRDKLNEEKHQEYLTNLPFSDLKVMEQILRAVPEFSNLQMANSTSVRYVQLFKPFKQLSYNANRGTSGIDGCTSTAAGAAYESKIPTTLITGDIAFLYDSNALWNKHFPQNLKIIILNNSGGGIFRFIEGSSDIEELEEFLETRHNFTAKHIAKNFNIDYTFCDKLNTLNDCLSHLYEKDQVPGILEIKTPAVESADILKSYFKFLKEEQ
ncbi:MAG: 2-succinyl-5-enolpyruvyl-6-hydroxy-3-cyclohexene-1-carboxylic-acid synthase [Bacteroidales bacterium]|nr:2-succinyl-5-enolpyruvyl-6-hydroxy-3-cyclohexene-1-carboxylic-acid synthase [Bacteroidales bacterium]MCF8457256.1 2-succinyl-5-enolpyruvyl-6-hydroxy-3-cyclohexene-1-carboxylic-acid synthase [Bacteroidales bacterium]